MRHRFAVGALAALLPLVSAASSLKPGYYEYIQSVDGAPAAKGSVCIDQADIDKHLEFIGADANARQCVYRSYRETGNSATFEVTCPTGDGQGEYTFTEDSLTGKSVWTIPAERMPDGKPGKKTTGVTASRLASTCKK